MKAGDKVIVIEADTHTNLTRRYIGLIGEVREVYSYGVTALFPNRNVTLLSNEIRPFKEYQVLKILRKWK